jgi:hypothetical protein
MQMKSDYSSAAAGSDHEHVGETKPPRAKAWEVSEWMLWDKSEMGEGGCKLTHAQGLLREFS